MDKSRAYERKERNLREEKIREDLKCTIHKKKYIKGLRDEERDHVEYERN